MISKSALLELNPNLFQPISAVDNDYSVISASSRGRIASKSTFT